ncbi:hypothetical protein EK904_015099 [Melospiza melodia maxima]|nr:hypothetical protein EK904_015099 [Melospiza melodia maxima]
MLSPKHSVKSEQITALRVADQRVPASPSPFSRTGWHSRPGRTSRASASHFPDLPQLLPSGSSSIPTRASSGVPVPAASLCQRCPRASVPTLPGGRSAGLRWLQAAAPIGATPGGCCVKSSVSNRFL